MDSSRYSRDELLTEIGALTPDTRAKFLREWGLLDQETCPKTLDVGEPTLSPNLWLAQLIWEGPYENEARSACVSDRQVSADEISLDDAVLIELDRPVPFGSLSFAAGLFMRRDISHWLEVLLGKEECPAPEEAASFVRLRIGSPFNQSHWVTPDEVRHYLWPLVEGRPAPEPSQPSQSSSYSQTNPDPDRFMSLDEWESVFAGISFANWCGTLFNVELTISWTKLGLSDDTQIKRAFETFLKRSRSWHSERDLEPKIWWVWERSEKNGLHTHMGLALPPEHRGDPRKRRAGKAMRREFAGFPDWPAATLGRLAVGPVMNPATVIANGVYDLVFRQKASAMSQWKWFAYCSKSLHPNAILKDEDEKTGANIFRNVVSTLHLMTRPSASIPCERVGISKVFGPGRRQAADYISPLERLDFPVDQFFSDRELQRGRFERQMKEQSSGAAEILQAVLALQVLERG